MKKKKKNNIHIQKAKILKNKILKFHNYINLPTLNDIKFTETKLINGINTFKFNYNLINKNKNIKIRNDNLFKNKIKSDVLVKTIKVRLFPNDEQKKFLLSWFDSWIEMYNKVISLIKEERKTQSREQINHLNIMNLI